MVASFLLAIIFTYLINHVTALSAGQAITIFILSQVALWVLYNVLIASLIKWPKLSWWGIVEIFLYMS